MQCLKYFVLIIWYELINKHSSQKTEIFQWTQRPHRKTHRQQPLKKPFGKRLNQTFFSLRFVGQEGQQVGRRSACHECQPSYCRDLLINRVNLLGKTWKKTGNVEASSQHSLTIFFLLVFIVLFIYLFVFMYFYSLYFYFIYSYFLYFYFLYFCFLYFHFYIFVSYIFILFILLYISILFVHTSSNTYIYIF